MENKTQTDGKTSTQSMGVSEMQKELLKEMQKVKVSSTFDLDQKYKYIVGKLHYDWENKEQVGDMIEDIWRKRRIAMEENPPEEKPQRNELSEEEKEENKRLFNQKIGSYSESILNGSYTE